MKKDKIGTVFFVSILALAGVGASFAGLSDIITVYGTVSTATVEFEISYSGTDVWKVYGPGAPEDEVVIWTGFSDDPLRPTKASLETQYPGCTALLVASSWAMPGTNGFDVDVVYDNIFPCVPFKANIAAHYIGSIPAHVTISNLVWNSGEEFFGSHLVFYSYLVYGNSVNFPLQMHYCDTLTIEVTITLPQLDALQGKSGSFSFDIEAIQWNDECNGQFPGKTINLPTTFVWGYYAHPGPAGLYSSYWDITLSGVPDDDDYNVENILYDGWCVSQYIYINPPGPYR
ncbi:MAG: hypothetical protein JXA75_06010, partial [Candidatus Thermoplasmatota archaeon]|nr:hypothetical protein [Candidatus Thermoplasmatota archaeon]